MFPNPIRVDTASTKADSSVPHASTFTGFVSPPGDASVASVHTPVAASHSATSGGWTNLIPPRVASNDGSPSAIGVSAVTHVGTL